MFYFLRKRAHSEPSGKGSGIASLYRRIATVAALTLLTVLGQAQITHAGIPTFESNYYEESASSQVSQFKLMSPGDGTMTSFVRADGTVVSLGNPPVFFTSSPIPMPKGFLDIVAMQSAAGGTVAQRSNGTLFAWGASQFGQLTIPASLGPVVTFAVGSSFCLALKTNGTVVGWGGNNPAGELNPPAGLTDVKKIVMRERPQRCLDKFRRRCVLGA